ncbi:MAG TPA: TlpA disulfide reductase family protein [Salinivirgaceae bacterium]|nr:TlpA disulfide reductase family protein [Salinivirgaceae bacterium]
MKKQILSSILMIAMATSLSAQKIPSVDLKTINGKIYNSSSITNKGKPIVISFWATWCKPCIKELSAFHDNYIDWQEETGVKIVAISTDDTRSMSRVAPFVNAKGWEFEVYCDPNGDFKRAMNVANVPHTFLIDGAGNIVWQHSGYVEGDEEVLYKKILELKK